MFDPYYFSFYVTDQVHQSDLPGVLVNAPLKKGSRGRDGDMVITPTGEQYNRASNPERQALFGRLVAEHVPLVAYIRQGLEQDPSGDLPKGLFMRLLRYTLNEADAEAALRVAIEWGRYANVFAYNLNTGVIHLPEAEEST